MTWLIIIALILACIWAPRYLIVGAGYLIQKYKFGVPVKEEYAYHKKMDALERKEVKRALEDQKLAAPLD